ncbi:MAG: glycosyltransferase, partial [Bacteroidia bacterium]|nr:glycosyltransferase [Bacteroidia bacterium]
MIYPPPPQVSVIMPVYNARKYLKESIESILNQTFIDFEFIIIEDGSTDNSPEIIRRYTDARIRLISNAKNQGIVRSLNQGLRLAQGKYLARMDADDISLPERFARQVKYLEENPEVDLLATYIQLINEDGRDKGVWVADQETLSYSSIRKKLPEGNCLAHPSMMFRASTIRKFRYVRFDYPAEDYGLWLRVASQ